MRRLLGSLVVVLSLVAGLGWAGEAQARSRFAKGEHKEDTLLVRFKSTASVEVREAHRRGHKALKEKDLERLVSGLQVWRLPKGAKLDEVLEALKADPDVAYAEPDHLQRALATPNDPRLGELWGLHNTGQSGGVADADIDALEAWDTATGSSEVVVGVVDTGVDYNHPDLAANMWRNPGEVAGNGVDDDGNGYVDDVYGWNAASDNGNPWDDNEHGTHCAGTIGAVGNNGIGVVGVAWNVRIMALKFLTASGSGSTADAIEAINYAVAQKRRGVNLRVLSNSWGGGGFSQALLDSINAAAAEDILFVAAAGNSSANNDTTANYPSNYDTPNMLAVASTTSTDGLSSFSSYGATTVDLGAPGSSILSTTPNNTYAVFSGTSMATPHVAGAAALVLGANGSLTYAQVKSALMSTVDPIPALNGRVVSNGRLNVARALASVGPPVPGFQLAVNPASRTLSQGQSTSFDIATTATYGFTGNVTLSLSSVPALAGATVAFSANPVPAGSGSVLSIATTTGTAAGSYNLTITGSGGGLTRSTSATLNVDPEGTVTLTFSNPAVISIPDANTTGIESTLAVPDSLSLLSTTVGVNITHTYIGDLEVSVVSPAGTTAILHNRTGGSADNINQSFQSAAFNGQNSAGTWRLRVRDLVSVDIGTLDRWTLTLKGAPAAPPPPDTSAPTVLLTSPASGATVSGNVAVSATASDNVAVREVRFFVDGAPLATDSTAPYSATWDSSTASPGSHVVAAQATDTSGNNSSLSQVTVNVASDTTPPVISSVAASSITGSSATISWSTNEPADSQVQYGTTTAYGSTTPLAPALVTSRSVQLTGLQRNTTYNYRVKSVDAAGNVSWSGNFTFRTAKR